MAFSGTAGEAAVSRPGFLARAAGTVKNIAGAVIFRHTLFSLPVALAALLLESGGHPPLKETVLILLAAAAGRNAANALNRVIDADIDKKNPRTADRHLPRGLLSKKALLLFSFGASVVVAASAFLLNPLCVLLLPAAFVLAGGYSFSKRFTWLCHYWLGAACAIAPMGAFIGLSGRFALRYFVVAGAHTLWVAGFDILYALQDIDFDRDEDLYSVPACFGAGAARVLSALSHAGTLLCYALLPFLWPLSFWYFSAYGIAAALLAAEHLVARGKTPRHIRIASYTINEIVPLVILAGTLLGIYL